MKAKLVKEAFKDVFKPKSKEDVGEDYLEFLKIYKRADKTWDLLHYRGSTLSTIPEKKIPLFGFYDGEWVYQIILRNKKIIARVFHKSESHPLEFTITSFADLKNIVDEYKYKHRIS